MLVDGCACRLWGVRRCVEGMPGSCVCIGDVCTECELCGGNVCIGVECRLGTLCVYVLNWYFGDMNFLFPHVQCLIPQTGSRLVPHSPYGEARLLFIFIGRITGF